MRLMTDMKNSYIEYEKQKVVIQQKATSPQEYERLIKELAERLEI